MSRIIKVKAPYPNEDLFLICIKGKAVGYPLSKEAANQKIEHLNTSAKLKKSGVTV